MTTTCGSVRPSFLKAGDKVKCTVIFRGREIQHTALAETLLRRMAKDLEEKAEIQQAPKREGRNMIMFLTPRKTPLVKKEEKSKPPTRPCARFRHPHAQQPPRWPSPRANPQGRHPAASAIPGLRPGDQNCCGLRT